MLESSTPIQNSACASDSRQEPGALVALAGICAGGARPIGHFYRDPIILIYDEPTAGLDPLGA